MLISVLNCVYGKLLETAWWEVVTRLGFMLHNAITEFKFLEDIDMCQFYTTKDTNRLNEAESFLRNVQSLRCFITLPPFMKPPQLQSVKSIWIPYYHVACVFLVFSVLHPKFPITFREQELVQILVCNRTTSKRYRWVWRRLLWHWTNKYFQFMLQALPPARKKCSGSWNSLGE